MTRCRIPENYERYKVNTQINDVKSKRILPRSLNQRNICFYNHKNHYCIIWKKSRKDSLLNAVDEREKNFKYVKSKINEDNLS